MRSASMPQRGVPGGPAGFPEKGGPRWFEKSHGCTRANSANVYDCHSLPKAHEHDDHLDRWQPKTGKTKIIVLDNLTNEDAAIS